VIKILVYRSSYSCSNPKGFLRALKIFHFIVRLFHVKTFGFSHALTIFMNIIHKANERKGTNLCHAA